MTIDSYTEDIDDGKWGNITITCIENDDKKRYYTIHKHQWFGDNTTDFFHNDLPFDDKLDCIESARAFVKEKFLSL